MSTQAAPAPAATPRPAAAPAPAPELPEKWALGDGYYYKHNVIKRRNGTDETLWVCCTGFSMVTLCCVVHLFVHTGV